MFSRLRHTTARGVVLGLAASVILIGGSAFVVEARPMLQTAPTLGTADSFVVLAAAAITNTGPSTLNGNVGLSPGGPSSITGLKPLTPTGPGSVVPPGVIHAADAVSLQARKDALAAYNSLAGQACTRALTGQDLGGLTLVPGVYCFTSSAQLTGALTLNALGSSSSVFVFKIASTLTTASSSSVLMTNGGSPCNVFWQVGSSATLGTTTTFLGTILADTSISLNNGIDVAGRLLAGVNKDSGAVTLINDTVHPANCAAVPTSTPVPPAAPAAAPPQSHPTPRPAPTAVLDATVAATATATATAVPTANAAATATAGSSAAASASSAGAASASSAGAATPNSATAGASSAANSAATATATAAVASSVAETARMAATATANAVETATAGAIPNENGIVPQIPNAGGPPVQLPTALPRTGGLPPLGIFSLVVGGLVALLGLTVRQIRK